MCCVSRAPRNKTVVRSLRVDKGPRPSTNPTLSSQLQGGTLWTDRYKRRCPFHGGPEGAGQGGRPVNGDEKVEELHGDGVCSLCIAGCDCTARLKRVKRSVVFYTTKLKTGPTAQH